MDVYIKGSSRGMYRLDAQIPTWDDMGTGQASYVCKIEHAITYSAIEIWTSYLGAYEINGFLRYMYNPGPQFRTCHHRVRFQVCELL